MEARLRSLLQRRRASLPEQTSCFRWVDGELDGVTVDCFGDVGVLSFYRPAGDDEARALAEVLASVGALRSVYVKHRPRSAKGAGEGAAPATPLWGASVDELEVQEVGVSFTIRPGNGLSVGLYLDARDARQWVRQHAAGRAVLNLFAYTCAFGVAALTGKATRAVNVDASRKVLDWGAQNTRLNGFAAERLDFIAGDAFDWLGRFAKKGETFGLVVLDPPGFASTKRSRFSAARDYHQLVEAAARVVAPGGLLLAMCNVEAMSLADLEAHLARGLAIRRFTVLGRFGASAVDYQQPPALKCVALAL